MGNLGYMLRELRFDVTHPSVGVLDIYGRFILSSLLAKLSGAPNLSTEALYWEYYCKNAIHDPPEWWDSSITKGRYNPEMRLILEILRKDFGDGVRLIDVGSGPVTSFFSYLDVYAWDVTTVDPLARLYNSLNKKYHINYPLECTEGYGESVSKLFPPESFHLVFSQNAIDHSRAPKEFVKNLYNLLKPNGFLYVTGFVNEGEASGWTGLHQHNLTVRMIVSSGRAVIEPQMK